MSWKKNMPAFVVALAGCLVILLLLARDGAFSSTWTVTARPVGSSPQMSDFGPPTRLEEETDPSGVQRRKVLAEPIYADVRVPSFFDEIEVMLRLWEAVPIEDDIRIGFELGRDSARYSFGETAVEAIPALGQGMLPTIVRARLPLVGVPHEDNRYRIVLSLPGVDPEHPVRIDAFTVTARRSGDWRALLSRFIPRIQPPL